MNRVLKTRDSRRAQKKGEKEEKRSLRDNKNDTERRRLFSNESYDYRIFEEQLLILPANSLAD